MALLANVSALDVVAFGHRRSVALSIRSFMRSFLALSASRIRSRFCSISAR